MKLAPFLIVTAIVEIGTGLFLLLVPARLLSLLLGFAESGPETMFVGRWVGAALLAIGVISALALPGGGAALRAVLSGILVYDVVVALLIAYAGAGLGWAGPALWPAVLLHTVLAVWCAFCLRLVPDGGAG